MVMPPRVARRRSLRSAVSVMWRQLFAIGWAQLRTMRNHLPRTSAGGFFSALVALLWYGLYGALGVALAEVLPYAPMSKLREWVPAGLLAMFLFWQFVPLFTLSGGWSIDLKRLQTFPIRNDTLFSIEVLLRLTTAPEMLLVLLGATAGLLRHPGIPLFRPLILLLYIPFNLFLSLAIRDILLRLFRKNRLRELVGLLIVALSVLPSILLTSSLGDRTRHSFLQAATGIGTPWHALSGLSLGRPSIESLAVIAAWCLAAYLAARWQFGKTLLADDASDAVMPSVSIAGVRANGRAAFTSASRLLELPASMFRDPVAAVMQKEFRSLRRIPRFRVIFGMACLFGTILFTQIMRKDIAGFGVENFLPLVNVYGFLLLGEVLLWNVFGFDRWATQLYYLAPVNLRTVLVAKNLVAIFFMFCQTILVFVVVLLLRFEVTAQSVVNEFAVSAVVAVFFLAAGNLASVLLPKRVDPNQTFRKQASGTVQVWMLLSSFAICLLLSFAFLARYALGTNWAFLGVLAVEFGIGVVVYRIATESAVEHAGQRSERLLEALSGSASPLSS